MSSKKTLWFIETRDLSSSNGVLQSRDIYGFKALKPTSPHIEVLVARIGLPSSTD